MALASVLISSLAFLVSLYVAVANRRHRSRQEAAAVMGELYPILRSARDAAFNFGKPLGGGKADQIVTFHNALKDLADLRPAIHDVSLGELVDRLFQHQAVGFAMSIDPERFIGMALLDDGYVTFLDCSCDCARAIERCQELRRGIG